MCWRIDRFEGEQVICETPEGSFVPLRRKALPAEAREGDLLCRIGETWQIDAAATNERRKQLRGKLRRLIGQTNDKTGGGADD